MKVYVGGSIKGGRDFAHGLHLISQVLSDMGHEVLTRDFVVNVDDLEDRSVDYEAIFERDIGKVEECQAFVAEVSQGSHGVGFEHCFSLMTGKPALVLRHASLDTEATRSAFLSGPGARFSKTRFSYYDEQSIRGTLEGFFAEFFLREGKIVRER